MTHRNETLSEQIEQLVRAHIEATRREASRGLGAGVLRRRPRLPRANTAPRPRRTTGRRRASTELSALGERLYEAVVAQPGETMAVLAPGLGCSPRELHRPMAASSRRGACAASGSGTRRATTRAVARVAS